MHHSSIFFSLLWGLKLWRSRSHTHAPNPADLQLGDTSFYHYYAHIIQADEDSPTIDVMKSVMIGLNSSMV